MIAAGLAQRHALGTFRHGQGTAVAKRATHEARRRARHHARNVAERLASEHRRAPITALDRRSPPEGPTDHRWRVAVNMQIDPDL